MNTRWSASTSSTRSRRPRIQSSCRIARLFEKLDDPLVLYLALLLHDTGRGIGARPHSEASALFAGRVASRLQLSSEERKSLVLLVDHHVTMSNMAQQRNLDDPETIIEFAGIVKNQRNLDALMLLTLADGQGTSAEGWSDWKESLVWQLYYATAQYLTDQTAFNEQMKIERETLSAEVSAQLPPDFAEEIEAHFDFMPDNYFRAFTVNDIVSHLRLFRDFFAKRLAPDGPPFAAGVKWESFPEQGHSIVSVCTWDRGSCSPRSPVPSRSFQSIFSARIFIRAATISCSTCFAFVAPTARPSPTRTNRQKVERALCDSLGKEVFDFAPLIDEARRKSRLQPTSQNDFPTRISIDNKVHPAYTLDSD